MSYSSSPSDRYRLVISQYVTRKHLGIYSRPGPQGSSWKYQGESPGFSTCLQNQLGVEPKIGVVFSPQNHPFVHRVWNHYFHHPFWDTTIFGNTQLNLDLVNWLSLILLATKCLNKSFGSQIFGHSESKRSEKGYNLPETYLFGWCMTVWPWTAACIVTPRMPIAKGLRTLSQQGFWAL